MKVKSKVKLARSVLAVANSFYGVFPGLHSLFSFICLELLEFPGTTVCWVFRVLSSGLCGSALVLLGADSYILFVGYLVLF
jgi:hypothetical protein